MASYTATFHTGKHIWSSTTGLDAGGAAFVVAGGADGRITCFFPRKHPTASVAPVGSPNAFILNNVLDQLQLLGSEGHLDTSANVPMEMDSRAKDSLDQVPNGPYDVEGKSSSVSVIASRKKTKLDAFKQYGFVAPNHIIAVTERGHILRASQTLHSPVQWKSVAQVPCVQSFARIVTSQEAAITFISATDGGLYSYSHKSEALQIITTSFPRIAGLFCQAVNILDTKGTKVRTLQLILTTLNSSSFHHGILPLDPPRQDNLDRPISYGEMKLPSQFVVTSVLVLEDAPLLLVGSRAGALAVFSHRQGDEIESTPSDPREAWKVFLKLHDRDAVTSILCLGDNPTVHDRGLTYILTTGRDGTYAVHELSWADDLEIMELKTVHRSSPPLGPMIEGCYYNTEGELILYGFRGQQFVTWNESRQSEIMSVACGGAHRIWDYCPPSQGNETASFVWSQASQMRLYSQKGGSHQILQKGGHGREIKTIAISPLELDISGVPSQLIATGSEDTTIRLFTYRPDGDQLVEPVFHCHGVLTKHTTGIQHLQWSPCGTYLFSSGGYEEFFVWRIRQVPGFGVGFVCEGVCPVESKAPDLRITAFDVMVVDGEKDDDQGLFLISMAFSDASLRTYLYNASPTHFQYLWTDFTPLKCCPTQVHHHITSTDINLITAGTNGHVTICNLTPILRESSIITENNRLRSSHQIAPDIVSSSPPTKVSFHHHRIHQNAIKSLTTAPLTRQTLLIATGGDDNALGLTLVTFPPTSSDDSDSRSIAPEISTLLLPSAHASAITALAFLPSSQEPSSLPSLSPPITDPKPPSNKELTSLRLLSTGNDQVLHTWRITINLAAPSPPRILKTNPPEESRNQMENVQIRREDSSPTPVAVADVADMAVLGAVRGSVRRGGDDRGTDDDEHGLRREGKENGLRVVICGVGVEVFRV
ncbi:MAG: hypothetical protein M1817_000077 [Caeruleum heppii]|nr:MAG: hypothetical protein M1817_000077 [Caeruleum heppii]